MKGLSGREKSSQYVEKNGGKRGTHNFAAEHKGRRIMQEIHTSRGKKGRTNGGSAFQTKCREVN